MLELRPNCECCDCDLPADQDNAVICSFECTFCVPCAENTLKGVCPNCGGTLVKRPTRSQILLNKNPASSQRVVKPAGCGA